MSDCSFPTVNTDDLRDLGLDFLSNDDDLILSQACEKIEMNYCFGEIKLEDFDMDFDADLGNQMNFDLSLETENGGVRDMDMETKNECVQNFEVPRFGFEVEEGEIQALIESQENRNTKKNTRWSFNIFESWRRERNAQCQGQELFIPEIETMDAVQLNFYLGRFIMRVRRKDGNEYPAKTLYYISCGILRYLRDREIYDKNFLDAADPRFAGFRKILDSKMKDALSRGVGGKRKQADPILPEDEATIWEKGIFGMNNAETLQNTVFYYSCKFFGLRGHDEHHSLQCDQFFLGEDNRGKFIEFTGRSTKTFKGGLAHKELHNKQIRHYCQPGERCMADFFKVYLDALGNEGSFYRRPLAGLPPRYGSQLVGVKKLKSLIKVICEKAGLKGNYTNHSGKRTCATALYQNGVEEQEIMGRTGHRSEMGVRAYKRGNAEIACTVSKVLNPPEPKLPKKEPKDALGPLLDISTSNKMNVHDKVEVLGQTGGSSTFNNCTFISY